MIHITRVSSVYFLLVVCFCSFADQLGTTRKWGHPKLLSFSASQVSIGNYRVSYLAENCDVIVVGRIVRVASAEESKPEATSKLKNPASPKRLVFTLSLEDVLKGGRSFLSSSKLDVLAIERPGDTHVVPLKSTTEEVPTMPAQIRAEQELEQVFPELTTSERFVFFLKFSDGSQASTEQQLSSTLLRSYRYVDALRVESQEVGLVKKYIALAQIQNLEEREQELVRFTFSLLRESQAPERFAKDALEDLCQLRISSAAKRLQGEDIEEVVQIMTDPKRPTTVRSWASVVLRGLVENGRSFDPNPLLSMVENSSDDVNLRLNAVDRLEQMNTMEIRQAIAAILAKSPKTEEDRIVWRGLAQSRLVKER